MNDGRVLEGGSLGSRSSAPSEAKRDVERYWLRYTLVWGIAAGGVMLSGIAERWTDRELMPFGMVLGLGAIIPPALAPRSAEEQARPLFARTATRLGLTVVAFAFGMNFFCTQYFYDVLHMHYGFHSTVVIRNNPVFLYLLTIAYFATYSAILLRAHRTSRVLAERLPKALAWLPTALAPFAVAGLETALNANPFMHRLFCYDDLGFALTFGTLSYGACFCFTLPVWFAVDETDAERPRARHIALSVVVAMLGMIVTFGALEHFVAPHFTRIAHESPGIGPVEGTCLAR